MNRILVIRGGAIGDFILTLPALKALRDAHPTARIEVLGYEHIAAIADNRFYAQAIRSIEYGPLSSFFAKNPGLPQELCDYFFSFDLIISYLYDRDEVFQDNLRRAGARRILVGPAKIKPTDRATRQLARPVEELGIKVSDLSPRIFPSVQDRQFANNFLGRLTRPIVAMHPGSGSKEKNWPIENWLALSKQLLGSAEFWGSLLIVSGEADEGEIREFESLQRNDRVIFAKSLPLPLLAALLEQTIFVGHDTGISHLAAAAGADCILFFGPTKPEIWAPVGERISLIRSRTVPDADAELVYTALMMRLANKSDQFLEPVRTGSNGSGADPHRH
jgi:heptosyltransferase-3